jgi:hypothetical protein
MTSDSPLSYSTSLLQMNFNTLENLIDQSIRSERKAVANQYNSDLVTALLQALLLVYCLASQLPDWYLVTRTAVIGIATLTVVGLAVLGRGFGAFMPSTKKRTGFSHRSDGEAYMMYVHSTDFLHACDLPSFCSERSPQTSLYLTAYSRRSLRLSTRARRTALVPGTWMHSTPS